MLKSNTGPLLIALAALLWGLDGILRRSLSGMPPITIVALEHALGFVLILPFFLNQAVKEKFTAKEKLAMLFIACLSSVLGTLWFTSALLATGFIPFSVVFLLQKLQPIFAVSGAAVVLKEKITRKYALWAGGALFFAFFVTFPMGHVDFSGGSLRAALLALGAAFAWGFSTPFSRYLLQRHSPTVVTGWRFILAGSIAGLVASVYSASSLQSVSVPQLTRLVIIALSTGMVALWIYYRGLKATEAKVAAILELIFPLTAVFIDIFLYKTVLHWTQYLAAALMLYATWRVSRLNRA